MMLLVNISTHSNIEQKSLVSMEAVPPPFEKHESLVSPATLPSTSKFPPPLQQVSPKTPSTDDIDKFEDNAAKDVGNTTEIPKDVIKTDIIQVTDTKLEVAQDTPQAKGKTAIDTHATNSSISTTSSATKETIINDEESSNTEKRSDIIEIESAVSSMNFLIDEAEKYEQICKNAVKNHSVLVEKVLENAIGNDSDTDDGTWTDVFEAANKKAETIEMAQVKLYN